MPELIRSIEVVIVVDTNKNTRRVKLEPARDEPFVDFIERVKAALEDELLERDFDG